MEVCRCPGEAAGFEEHLEGSFPGHFPTGGRGFRAGSFTECEMAAWQLLWDQR